VAPERAQPRAQGIPSVTPPARPTSAEDRLGALLAMARTRLAAQEAGAAPEPIVPAEPLVGRAPLAGRRITSLVDDDLFEDAPLSLERYAGARR